MNVNNRFKLLSTKTYLTGAWVALFSVVVVNKILGFEISWFWLLTWGLMFITTYFVKYQLILMKEKKGG